MEKYRTICVECHESKPKGRYDTSDYCSDICEINGLRTANARYRAALEKITPFKIRALADWLDIVDAKFGHDDNSKYNECQKDLRTWAKMIEQALAEGI